ncbi:hypothetical protein Cyast_0299 [Cyanobacterium stanieri PCC 7202]|uniref:Uncharacterized protein n=1 Tax=Cyanobacterium stanieri (strain ATCC 29140 / PCC 7202) TaxID=292563 RepID=K9YHG5_CYASC|nr:hypothetical protein Cyast_0299 [Cyanobacterium stanieri PCC 7202]
MNAEYLDIITIMVIVSVASVVLLPIFSWVISNRTHA